MTPYTRTASTSSVLESIDTRSIVGRTRRVRAVHPALGEIDGYAWIAFVGAHAARHAAQIDEAYGLP